MGKKCVTSNMALPSVSQAVVFFCTMRFGVQVYITHTLQSTQFISTASNSTADVISGVALERVREAAVDWTATFVVQVIGWIQLVIMGVALCWRSRKQEMVTHGMVKLWLLATVHLALFLIVTEGFWEHSATEIHTPWPENLQATRNGITSALWYYLIETGAISVVYLVSSCLHEKAAHQKKLLDGASPHSPQVELQQQPKRPAVVNLRELPPLASPDDEVALDLEDPDDEKHVPLPRQNAGVVEALAEPDAVRAAVESVAVQGVAAALIKPDETRS